MGMSIPSSYSSANQSVTNVNTMQQKQLAQMIAMSDSSPKQAPQEIKPDGNVGNNIDVMA